VRRTSASPSTAERPRRRVTSRLGARSRPSARPCRRSTCGLLQGKGRCRESVASRFSASLPAHSARANSPTDSAITFCFMGWRRSSPPATDPEHRVRGRPHLAADFSLRRRHRPRRRAAVVLFLHRRILATATITSDITSALRLLLATKPTKSSSGTTIIVDQSRPAPWIGVTAEMYRRSPTSITRCPAPSTRKRS
jgi:hypothetical protein